MGVFRRVASGTAVIAAVAMSAACNGGRGTPAAPSPQAVPTAFGTITVQPTAQCFQFAGDPACFSAARMHRLSTLAGAITPSAPTGLAGSAFGTTVVLTWNAPGGGDPATGYIVEAGSSAGQSNLANFATGSTSTTLSAPNVPAGSYYVRVRATNGSGTSAPSNEVLLVVGGGGCTTAPGAPSGLTVAFNSGGTVVLSWNAASGSPSTYIVEAGSTPGSTDLVNSDLDSRQRR